MPARKSSTASTGQRTGSNFTLGNAVSGDRMAKLRELAANPAVQYVARGLATAVFGRIASNLANRYPQITTFLRENLDFVEEKLGDFKSSLGGDADHARH